MKMRSWEMKDAQGTQRGCCGERGGPGAPSPASEMKAWPLPEAAGPFPSQTRSTPQKLDPKDRTF